MQKANETNCEETFKYRTFRLIQVMGKTDPRAAHNPSVLIHYI